MGLSNFLESKVLALAVLILFIATLVSIGCGLMPWWFRLEFGPQDATYGSEGERTQDLDIGIFYIYKPNKPGAERNHVLMTSLLAMDAATNLPVVPPMYKLAQVFYTIGMLGIAVGWGGGLLLAVKQFGSLTGNFGLSVFTILAAIFQIVAVLFLLITSFDSSNEWHMLPLENPFRIVITSHPTMHLNWTYFISLIGAGLSLFGAILLTIDALKLCKSVEGIRARQRKTKPPQDPYPDIRYTRFTYDDVVRPKPEYPHYGHHTQPGVVLSRGPPQPFIAQPQPYPQAYSQPPRYGGYHPQPSPNTSQEAGGYGLRQVDL